MRRLAIYGHSGSGKSKVRTVSEEILRGMGLRVEVIKLAEPLYELQGEVYRAAGRPIPHYEQDQVMLEWLARQMRAINPKSLVESFDRRLGRSAADVVICDDLRDGQVDLPYLLEKRFFLLYVSAGAETLRQRLGARSDLSTVHDSETTRGIESFPSNYVIDNDGLSLEQLAAEVHTAMDAFLAFRA